jgi:3-hydroxybutyrate dehydrogenase
VASVEKAAYVAAKHGIVGLTKVVALENAENGITANAICPGWVRTPLVEKQIEALAARHAISIDEATVKLLEEKQPSKRFVTIEQIGEMAVFLAGPAASNITGQTMVMDGGWVAR